MLTWNLRSIPWLFRDDNLPLNGAPHFGHESKTMLRTACFLISLTLISGCGLFSADEEKPQPETSVEVVGQHWSEGDMLTFVKHCKSLLDDPSEGNTEAFYMCFLDVVINRYPDPHEVMELQEPALLELIYESDCHKEYLESIEIPGWTAETEEAFMEECKRQMLADQTGETAAKNYCRCVLDGIKALYSDPELASPTEEEMTDIALHCTELIGDLE